MNIPHELVSQVAASAESLGFVGITPIVLSNGANLLVHLAPYPVVARAAKLRKEEAAASLAREIRVACHLHANQVPVVRPVELHPGPVRAGGTWMTCWEYVAPASLHPLSPDQAIRHVELLSSAIAAFPESLQALDVWDKSHAFIQAISKRNDPRIDRALKAYWNIDERMRRMDPGQLVPSHGDAHARNLLPSPDGWRWNDFEDVCLMPRYWDLASFIGNLALFKGFDEPVLQTVLHRPDVCEDREAFGFALCARILVSTLSNAALALEGHGDWSFADRQLDRCGDFLSQVQERLK